MVVEYVITSAYVHSVKLEHCRLVDGVAASLPPPPPSAPPVVGVEVLPHAPRSTTRMENDTKEKEERMGILIGWRATTAPPLLSAARPPGQCANRTVYNSHCVNGEHRS